jgi:hypothetical protein
MNVRSLLDVVLNTIDRLIADFEFGIYCRLFVCQRCIRESDPDPFNQNNCIGSVADQDPGSGAFLSPGPGSGIRKTGWKSGPESGMNIPDHFSESLETVFRNKIFKFFDADPEQRYGIRNLFDRGFGILDSRSGILYSHPRSATLITGLLPHKTTALLYLFYKFVYINEFFCILI